MRITPCHNWKQTHENTDGLDDLIREIFSNSLYIFKIYQYLHSSRFSEGYIYGIDIQELQSRIDLSHEKIINGIEKLKDCGFLIPIENEDDHYFFYEFPLKVEKNKKEEKENNIFKKEIECIWVPGYENLYAVSCNGVVYTERKSRVLIPVTDENGEQYVTLTKNYMGQRFTLSELRSIAKEGGLKYDHIS